MMRKRRLWLIGALAVLGLCACKGRGAEGGAETSVVRENALEDNGTKTGTGGAEAGGTQSGAGDGKGGVAQSGAGNVENGGSQSGAGDGKNGGKDGENGEGTRKEEDFDSGERHETGNGEFRTGTWDGLVFVNPWMGVAIPFPEGTHVFSEEEMRSMVGESDAIAINSGDWEDVEEKAANALNIYDFMVTMPDGRSSVQLAYMNAEKVDPNGDISAADCLEEMAGELASVKDMGYEVGALEKAGIGGKTFDRFTARLMGGALYQEYYGIRVGDYVAILTASYEENGKAAVEELIGGIRGTE
ncbi:MAG: hypothetical protein HFG74_05190 [Hungatella sp.]|jgi:hypothetical protein|nr:hypothetical protein [Hungatella sp.]